MFDQRKCTIRYLLLCSQNDLQEEIILLKSHKIVFVAYDANSQVGIHAQLAQPNLFGHVVFLLHRKLGDEQIAYPNLV